MLAGKFVFLVMCAGIRDKKMERAAWFVQWFKNYLENFNPEISFQFEFFAFQRVHPFPQLFADFHDLL